MTVVKTNIDRRSFLKTIAVGGGGLLLGFNLGFSKNSKRQELTGAPDDWVEINGFLEIAENGAVTIKSPNPEFGQNVMTSMPMIVAEELDIDWERVTVKQAPFNTDIYTRQMAGGSQSIRQGWNGLRVAGASARFMLIGAVAAAWNVPSEEITTGAGVLYHADSGRSAHYGEFASAAAEIPVPEEVELKDVSDFTIVGSSRKNVVGKEMVTGKPMFGLDYEAEGMLIAMIVQPPAFGMKLKSYDDSAARSMPGIRDIFTINTFPNDFTRGYFDANAFPEMIAVVGETTWEVMNAKKAITAEWEEIEDTTITVGGWGGPQEVTIPAGLESTEWHMSKMKEMASQPGNVERRDGDPESAFANASQVIEREYTAPYLAHNSMEPINFFANVTDEKAELAGPLQAPEFAERTLVDRLGLPPEKVDIKMTRMGGGFGRRAYGHYPVEAALISKKAKAPIKMIYTREDDMSFGIYRPTYHAKFRAALDENNNMIAFHVKAGGIPESALHANRFPAGAVENYLAESWSVNSNITIGAFRAPGSNFMGAVEQSFLDEVAEAAGKDPIDFRLELFEHAKNNPVGEDNDYDADRYAGVLELVRDKSGWDSGSADPNVGRGVAAYFCHNSYAAHVVDMTIENGEPVVQKVTSAVDCGIVVNEDAAINMVEGAVVDGIGNALYGKMTFTDGVPDKNNFNNYRMIRMSEAPKEINVHFVQNDIDPTGLGEPPFPPIFAAVANSLYKTTGRRFRNQPFTEELNSVEASS